MRGRCDRLSPSVGFRGGDLSASCAKTPFRTQCPVSRPERSQNRAVATILVVDDREEIRMTFQVVLAHHGHDVVLANNGQEAIDQYRIHLPDIVILDMFMPVMNGFDALFLLRQEFPDVPVIAMSGGGKNMGADALEEARNLGARLTLQKPVAPGDLIDAVDGILSPG